MRTQTIAVLLGLVVFCLIVGLAVMARGATVTLQWTAPEISLDMQTGVCDTGFWRDSQ